MSLAYTDTDSFILSVYSNSLLSEIRDNIPTVFDFSNLNSADPAFDESNKGVLGKMKVETSSHIMTGLTALKSKCYAYMVQPFSEESATDFTKMPNGFDKRQKSTFHFNDYAETLKNDTVKPSSFRSIRSHKHRVYLETM